MSKHPTNMGASIQQRLKNRARETGVPLDRLLRRYGIERFLYRLSQSEAHRDKLILKGAQMLIVWRSERGRPTMDADFLGFTENTPERLKAIVQDICAMDYSEEDGLTLDSESVKAMRIKEDAEYEGVRVTFQGRLDSAKIPVQIDVGFNDVITPAPATVTYPSLLDLPEPELRAYNRESLIAEKFEAMVKLGELNSRMKDFFDVWLLSEQFTFSGKALSAAVEATFKRRGTERKGMPVTLLPDFAGIKDKQTQWKAWLSKNELDYAPPVFADVAKAVNAFLKPIVDSLLEGKEMKRDWNPQNGWEKQA